LKVFNDAFVISRDTLGDGFNQIKGQKLYGQFKDNELYLIDIINNAESIYYLRNDENELVGIDKSKSGNMKIWVTENTIDEVRKIRQIDGSTYPESQFPDRERILNGFDWRDDERPKSVEDLFVDDPPLSLPIIKGLEDYVPQEEFFDDKMIDRVNKSDQSKKGTKNKAARNIPKPLLDQKKPTGKLKAKKDQN
ncbi:MAG: hypothetical protein KJO77_03400, partial [Bacteroidia bacterium]|nr:hypothetical protein [Bacteroidia bacterium]